MIDPVRFSSLSDAQQLSASAREGVSGEAVAAAQPPIDHGSAGRGFMTRCCFAVAAAETVEGMVTEVAA
jgi:hypothetical protein